ncbi:MAG: carbon-nitrogen hydrolase family protein [Neisseriaceae bacterium]
MEKKVAVIQMVSSADVEENIDKALELIGQASSQGADWVVLPEYWSLLSTEEKEKLAIREAYGKGRLQEILSKAASRLKLVIFGGSLSLSSPEKDKVFNSMLVFDRQGKIISRYDKRHLFLYEGENENYQENNTIKPGSGIVQNLEIDSFRIAQGICFDIRFPEFFRQQLPFEILVLPAAFTYATGEAHWEILLRARAIENQCYVLASAQGGIHAGGRRTFGHSMIISPWGTVLNELEAGEGVITARVRQSEIQRIRKQLPIF